jgi:hypothetical protein
MQLRDLNVSRAGATDAGMFGIWRTSVFAHVSELDQWEDEVAEDSALARQIADGAFVPLNIGGGGAFQAAVRGVESPGQLSEREREYLLVSSEPYLLISDGELELGGLEGVGNYSGAETVGISLDSGQYAVVVHLLDWQAEPGSRGSGGEPSPNALPDFIVEIFADSRERSGYRAKVETFERS